MITLNKERSILLPKRLKGLIYIASFISTLISLNTKAQSLRPGLPILTQTIEKLEDYSFKPPEIHGYRKLNTLNDQILHGIPQIAYPDKDDNGITFGYSLEGVIFKDSFDIYINHESDLYVKSFPYINEEGKEVRKRLRLSTQKTSLGIKGKEAMYPILMLNYLETRDGKSPTIVHEMQDIWHEILFNKLGNGERVDPPDTAGGNSVNNSFATVSLGVGTKLPLNYDSSLIGSCEVLGEFGTSKLGANISGEVEVSYFPKLTLIDYITLSGSIKYFTSLDDSDPYHRTLKRDPINTKYKFEIGIPLSKTRILTMGVERRSGALETDSGNRDKHYTTTTIGVLHPF